MEMTGERFEVVLSSTEGKPVLLAGSLRVRMLSWAARGGCERALVDLENAPGSFSQWTDLPGKAVRIYNQFGSLVWWGYVQGASREEGSYALSRSLASLANRVAVRYTELEPQGESFGSPRQTNWAEDQASVLAFGKKELLLERGLMAGNAALQLRDQTLSRSAEPELRLSLAKRPSEAQNPREDPSPAAIHLECLGWYHRLNWRVYQAPMGLLGNASAQQGSQSLGNTTSFQKAAQSFLTDSSAALPAQAQVRVRRFGSPTDSLKLALQADNGSGSPSGVDLAAASLVGANLAPEAYPWATFGFIPSPQLLANTSYWLVLSRTGAVSAANYYLLAVDEKLSYPEGTFKTYNGSVWTGRSVPADLVFKLSTVWESTDLLAEAAGLFLGDPFSRVSVECRSGVFLTSSSANPLPADRFAQSLMELGTERLTGMVCMVDQQLALVFAERPTAQEAGQWTLSPEGDLRKPGGELCLPGELPVGAWLRCGEHPPVFITRGQISAPDWMPRLESG